MSDDSTRTSPPAAPGRAAQSQIDLFGGRAPVGSEPNGPPGPRGSVVAPSSAGVQLEEIVPGIAAITFASPGKSINILTAATLGRLREVVAAIRSSARFRGVLVRSSLPGSFIAGADVNEIAAIDDPAVGRQAAEVGQAVLGELADLSMPVVAAINGACLGGGAELALACHYRIASDSPRVRIGLPEVRLGILPGFGGTHRLPHLVGLRAGLDLILTQRTLDARRARRIGFVDVVIPDAIFDREAVRFVERAIAGGEPARGVPAWTSARQMQARRKRLPLRERFLESFIGRPVLFAATRRKITAMTRGQFEAPLVALDTVRRGFGRPLRVGLAAEARALGERIASEEKRALVHVFFLGEANRRETGASRPDVTPQPVLRAALVGAGTMGGGIAQILARRGIPVRMKDLTDEALLGALRAAAEVYGGDVRRGRLRQRDVDHQMTLIHPSLDYTGFGRVEVVFEAVVEQMTVKQTVLREVEAAARPGTVFATNTSALSVTELASAARRPQDVAGFHFFNPVHRMPLVEIVRGKQTSDETVVTLVRLARRLGKTPILCQDGPGFLVNRLLGRYLNEASHLLAEGLSVERCDRVAVEFGMPMGPLRLIDEVGVDVAAKVATALIDGLGERYQTNNLLKRMAGERRLGKKTGRGFYRYGDGRRSRRKSAETVDPAARALIETGGRRFDGSDRVIRDRLFLVMIDEAARCLEEGIVKSPGDVDIGMIFGTGFPPFRGGLLRHADRQGARDVAETLSRLAETVSPRFAPCEQLRQMAARSQKFYA